MSDKTHILLIIFTVFFFLMVIRGTKKSRLSTEMAVVWTIFSFSLILISLFPMILSVVSEWLGIKTVINTVYLFILFLIICMLYYLCVRISILEERLKNLIQVYSIKKTDDSENEEQ